MGRKKTGAIPTVPPKEKEKMVIDMNRVARAKAYHNPGFRTGKHMSQKDRPRKKDWRREYERQTDRWSDKDPGPFFLCRKYRFRYFPALRDKPEYQQSLPLKGNRRSHIFSWDNSLDRGFSVTERI